MPPDPAIGYGQLTLDVKPHPQAMRNSGLYIAGSLKVSGHLVMRRDLNAGDQLVVLIQNADGELLARHLAEVGPVTTKPIEDREIGVIGMERIHSAKLGDEA